MEEQTAIPKAKRKLQTILKATFAVSLSVALAITGILIWSEAMTNEPDDVSIVERYQILDTLPKEKGKIKTLDSGVKIKRIDAKRKNELPYLNAMGGISAKWALIDDEKEYELNLTFDNLPQAIVYTIFHPEHFKEFYDRLGGDKDIASIVKQASKYGFNEIKNQLPEYEESYFE